MTDFARVWTDLPIWGWAIALTPAFLAGAWVERVVVKRLSQKAFERLVIAFAGVAGVCLLVA